jgi:2,3-bisphosphoglycerate-dependent phosphoglycerate mutase
MGQLILIRHGQSTWNAQNRFTGWVDVPLSPQGRREAIRAANLLETSGIVVQVCYTSLLIRAIETAVICLTEAKGICNGKSPVIKHDENNPDWHGWDHYEGEETEEVPIFTSMALDERNYGTLQGLNKEQTAARVGTAQVQLWRRSYSTSPPGGESLADTARRTLPFFESRILAHLQAGESVLVSAHGNSLRSIIMQIDGLAEAEVPGLELMTATPIVYDYVDGKWANKQVLDSRSTSRD